MLFLADENDVAQFRKFFASQLTALASAEFRDQFVNRLQVVMIAKAVNQCQCLEIGLLDQILKFETSIMGVDGDQHRADLGGGKHEGRPVRYVGRPYADIIALADTDRQQPLGQLINAFVELLEGKT